MPTASRELFDRHAEVYNSPIPRHIQEHYLNKRVRFIQSLASLGRVLDTGCGTALLLERLMSLGYRVCGVDESFAMIDQCQGLRGRLCQGDSPCLPYQDNVFDIVLNIAVMHHVGDPERIESAIREMVRVAKPGGKIVIWDHNPINPYWKIFMKKLPWDDHVHRLIPRREIIAAFKNSSVEKVEACYLGLMPDFAKESRVPFWRALERVVENLFFTRWLCAHNVVVGYKE